MKKFFVTVLLVLTAFIPVFAENGGFGLRLGNDCWTGGFSYNNDDLLSYTFGLQYEGSSFSIVLDADGFTGRYLDDRFDLVKVLYSQNIPVNIKNFSLTACAGFDLYGFMHLDFFQNALHRIMKIQELDLPYKKSDISFIPVLGISSSYGPVYVKACADFGFEYTEEAGLDFSYDILSVKAAYSFVQKVREDVVLDNYVDQSAGALLHYSFDRGKFRLSYCVNPFTGNGYGTMIVSPFAQIPESRFEYTYLPELVLSQFKASFVSNEVELENGLIVVSRFATGAQDTKRLDDFLWGAGYSFDFGPFSFRAVAEYNHHWERIPEGTSYKNTHSNHAGLSVEALYSLRVFRNSSFRILGGASYFTGLGPGYEWGLGFSL